VREAFGLHELAVEDAQSFHLRPKIERYDGDVTFVILRTARYDAEREDVEFGEISVFVAARSSTSPLSSDRYFRDVRDHLRLVNEEVTAQRDLLTTCLEANMAVISVEQTKLSVRQNDSIKQLTIIATVFLPLTVVTGFFGQNFGWLVGRIDTAWAFVVFGIGGLVLPRLLLYGWFSRSEST
jgi:Mg2+ and Co2+ transporter CorA